MLLVFDFEGTEKALSVSETIFFTAPIVETIENLFQEGGIMMYVIVDDWYWTGNEDIERGTDILGVCDQLDTAKNLVTEFMKKQKFYCEEDFDGRIFSVESKQEICSKKDPWVEWSEISCRHSWDVAHHEIFMQEVEVNKLLK